MCVLLAYRGAGVSFGLCVEDGFRCWCCDGKLAAVMMGVVDFPVWLAGHRELDLLDAGYGSGEIGLELWDRGEGRRENGRLRYGVVHKRVSLDAARVLVWEYVRESVSVGLHRFFYGYAGDPQDLVSEYYETLTRPRARSGRREDMLTMLDRYVNVSGYKNKLTLSSCVWRCTCRLLLDSARKAQGFRGVSLSRVGDDVGDSLLVKGGLMESPVDLDAESSGTEEWDVCAGFRGAVRYKVSRMVQTQYNNVMTRYKRLHAMWDDGDVMVPEDVRDFIEGTFSGLGELRSSYLASIKRCRDGK